MDATARRKHGFTIVEMLVVVSIIGVLAAILLPALAGAQDRMRKLRETHYLRQVGLAWNLYANSNDGAALPGHIAEDVQTRWDVTYKLPDKEDVDPADAEEWPWRLLPYLEFDHDVILGYQGLDQADQLRMSDYANPDPDGIPRPVKIAEQPAFGYNAHYVGGWWTMVDIAGELHPRPRFYGATVDDLPIRAVARSVASIRNTERMVLFCSSSKLEPGQHADTRDFTEGSPYVVPPFLADDPQWQSSSQTAFATLLVVADESIPVPIGRYTGQAAVLHADLHISPTTPGALYDQRFWIDVAETWNFTHDPGPG